MSSMGDAQQIVRAAEMPLAPGWTGEPAAPAPEGGLNLGEAWRILKQRKQMVFVTFVVLYALMVAATLIVWKWFPAYPATAYLELRPPPEKPFELSPPLVDPKIMEMLLTTEARKISRLDVLMDVLSLKEIQNTAFYRWYPNFEECLFDLQKYLSVSPVPETHLIQVSLAIRDANEAKRIVDTVVTRYAESFRRAAGETNVRAFDDLKNTRVKLLEELENKRRDLANFRARTEVGAADSEKESLARSIADLRYVVNTYDARATDLQAQLDSVQGIDPRRLPVSPEDRVIVEADPLLRLWRQQVESLDVSIQAQLASIMLAKHRTMQFLQKQREGSYEREVARREELLDDLRERKVDALNEELARVRSMQGRMQDQLDALESRQADLDASRVKYEALLKDEDRLQKSLEKIDEAVLQFQHLAASTPETARLSVVQLSRKAVEPSRPAVKLWLGAGVFLALVGAVGLAFLRELTDKAVRTPIDVARHGRLSVLGSIPQLDDEHADVETIELATRQAPQSLVAEAFRQVRANLIFSGPAETRRVLLITSPGPGNGKTSVAINLAVTLAQGGQRVLLVDCNFRRPAIRSAFAGTRAEGLCNLLVGQAKLEEVVTATDIPNLHVLTSGPMPPTPAELLGSQYMRDLIAQARTKYDRVIFDGPPVLLISDALVLATQVDGVIMVARAVENTKGGLRRAREQLEKINAHVVGAILNGAQARAGGYYRQQYREFYDYTSDETIPRELPGAPLETPDQPPSRKEDWPE